MVQATVGTNNNSGRNYVDFDDMSEAAVERWLTSPAASTSHSNNGKVASPTTSISAFGGTRHSHTGVFSASDVDSATRSMSIAAAVALEEARTTLSSPGGQNANNSPTAAPAGRAILRERLRQRVKTKGSNNSARVLERQSIGDADMPDRHPSSQTGTSTCSASSSVTPQHRLESLLQGKGLMSQQVLQHKKRDPTTPSTASSNSTPSNSDVLKAFLGGGDVKAFLREGHLEGGSPLSDSSALRTRLGAHAVSRVRSANTTMTSKSSSQRSGTREVEQEMLAREVAALALAAPGGGKNSSGQSSPRPRRKSATGTVSAPSSPRRRSSAMGQQRLRRQGSNNSATHGSEAPSVRPQEYDDGESGESHTVISTSDRGENRIFFGRSSDTPSTRSSKGGANVPVQQPEMGEDDVEGPKVTPSVSQRNFSSLREVRTFSPRSSVIMQQMKPKNRQPAKPVSSSMVVESREQQSESMHQKMRRPVKYERRQSFVPPSRTNRIRLHVYDLIAESTVVQLPWGCHFPIGQCFNVVNSSLHELGTGAYHVGVEVNGVEYAYGSNETRNTTGVFTCMPKHSPGYQYRTTIDFGERTLLRTAHVSEDGKEIRYKKSRDKQKGGDSVDEIPEGFRAFERQVDGREVLREMAREYMGTDYDLLRKNCCTFAHDAAIRLGVKDNEVPSWFVNLCYAGALTQDAAVSTMQPITKVFSSCDCDNGDEMPEYIENTGFEVINTEQMASSKGRSAKHGGSDSSDRAGDADSKFRRTSSWQY